MPARVGEGYVPVGQTASIEQRQRSRRRRQPERVAITAVPNNKADEGSGVLGELFHAPYRPPPFMSYHICTLALLPNGTTSLPLQMNSELTPLNSAGPYGACV